MRRTIAPAAFAALLVACATAYAEVEEVKVGLALDSACAVVVSYTNTGKAALNGTLTLNVGAGPIRKDISDRKIALAPGKNETIKTGVKVSGETWVFVQTSFSGAGTAIMVPADKTLTCAKK